MEARTLIVGALLLFAFCSAAEEDENKPGPRTFWPFPRRCDKGPDRMKDVDYKQFLNGKWYMESAMTEEMAPLLRASRCNTFESKIDGTNVETLRYYYFGFRYHSKKDTLKLANIESNDEISFGSTLAKIFGFNTWRILNTDYKTFAVVYSCSPLRGKVAAYFTRDRKPSSASILDFDVPGINPKYIYTDESSTQGCPNREPSID